MAETTTATELISSDFFRNYNPTTDTLNDLVDAIFTSPTGVTIGSDIVVGYGTGYNESDYSESSSISFYNGNLSLGIGSGLLLTSGDARPPLQNTSSSYSMYFSDIVDGQLATDLEQTLSLAFDGAGSAQDISSLTFTLNNSLTNIKGLSFDVVFGSDEYPEYSDTSFVDIAAVYINGVNYALFNNSTTQPLSILDQNLNVGNFFDNTNGDITLEYDGISSKLQITAPINQGQNTISIAIADTGDSAYDSGLLISNLQLVDFDGNGLAEVISIPESQAGVQSDSTGNEVYEFNGGINTLVISGGDDIVQGGTGMTTTILPYALNDISDYSLTDKTLVLEGPSGKTTMIDIDHVKLNDMLAAFDTNFGQDTWQTLALLNAGFNAVPDTATLSQWVVQANASGSIEELAQKVIDHYAPDGLANETLVTLLFKNITGVDATQSQIDGYLDQIGTGKAFEDGAALYAAAAQSTANTNDFVNLIGSFVELDNSFFNYA